MSSMPENRKPEEMLELMPFIKPDRSFYEFFKGYNTRELLPSPAMSRKDFMGQATRIVNESKKIALENGLSEEDADRVQMQTIRNIAEQSLFFFCIFVLNMDYADNDFVYRLCNDVQHNKWKKLWVIAREHYKDLACDTPILTTKGWKNHGDLVPGDVIFTPKGTSPVVAVRHFTDSHCRKVNFRGGNSIVCGNGHLWKVNKYTTSRKVHDFPEGERGTWYETVCETSDVMEGSYKHPYITVTGYHIEDDIELPIPPYTLGAWLGDGESLSGRISKPDDEIFENVMADGFEISHDHCKGRPHCQTRTVYGLMPMLRKEGLLGNKHIPEIYFSASDRQRLALLQGLMDTDGSMSKNPKNGATFSSSRKELAEGVLALANSLGFKAMMSPVRKYDAYNVCFPVKKSDLYYPFRMARKLANISDRPHHKQAHNWYIQSIEEHETVPTNCIQIADPDGIYLAGKSLIPTHNSTIITCASTLWEVLKNPELTYCIYSFKEDAAAKFLGQIKIWCETNVLLRKLWPDVIPDNPGSKSTILPNGKKIEWKWSTTQLQFIRKTTCKEMTIEASGLGGNSKTGMHFSRQIYDDVETQYNVGTPEAIEKLYGEFSMSFNTGQTDNLEFCVVGTFYARADIYAMAIKNGIFKESIIQPCVDRNGIPIRFSYEKLQEKYDLMGASVFATQMMNNPSQSSVSAFDSDWIHRWKPNPEGMNMYVIVDPASGKTSKRHDFTSIWVVGIDQFKKLMVFDLIEDKFGVEERFRKLVDIIREYEPLQIFHEQVAMQQDITLLQEYMDKYNTHFAITPFNPVKWGDKDSRILKLKDAFEAGKVFLPNNGKPHIDYEGKSIDMLDRWYRDEYLGYPTIVHDDGLDSLASLYLLLIDGYLSAPAQSFMNRRRTIVGIDGVRSYSPMTFARESGVQRRSLFRRERDSDQDIYSALA